MPEYLSSSESVYENMPTNKAASQHNIFGEPVSSAQQNGLPVEKPMPAHLQKPSATANVVSKITDTMNGARFFLFTHGQTLLVVCVFVLIAIALYFILRLPVSRTWWNKITSFADTSATTMKLPRDGKTSVVASKPGKVYVTKKKASKSQPASHEHPDTSLISPNDKEVFNISNNIYTYEDAPAVCKAYNARLATQEEVHDAFDKGADWCNYGWTQGQVALFPTQKATFNRMQTIEGHEHDCGIVGVNGGYFQNPDLEFGVNCYGKKPEPRMKEKEMIGYFPDFTTDKEKRMKDRVAEIKKNSADITITAFNSKQWDANRTFSESVSDWLTPS